MWPFKKHPKYRKVYFCNEFFETTIAGVTRNYVPYSGIINEDQIVDDHGRKYVNVEKIKILRINGSTIIYGDSEEISFRMNLDFLFGDVIEMITMMNYLEIKEAKRAALR